MTRALVKNLAGSAVGVIVVLLFLSGAIYNGYPMVFSDSRPYVHSSFTFEPPVQRPIFYGYLIYLSRLVFDSLWSVVALQAIFATFLIYLAIRLRSRLDHIFLVLCGVLLASSSSLPWFVGQVMPDILTGLIGLCLYVLIFRWRSLTIMQRVGVVMIFGLSTLTHLSHYLIVAAAAAGVFVYDVAFTRALLNRRSYLVIILVLLFGFILAKAVNRRLTGRAEVSGVGHAFIMGRLVEDGIIYQLLVDHCDEKRYALCPHKDRLVNRSVDRYLWDNRSPMFNIGGWEGSREASWRMIKDSVRYYPWEHVRAALRATWRQFTTFHTGIELTRFRARRNQSSVSTYFPQEAPQFLGARQISGELRWSLGPWAAWHRRVAIFSLWIIALVALAAPFFPRDLRRSVTLAPFVIIFLTANAAVTGIFSGVFDRYQSRVVWLAPLAALVSLRCIANHFWPLKEATILEKRDI